MHFEGLRPMSCRGLVQIENQPGDRPSLGVTGQRRHATIGLAQEQDNLINRISWWAQGSPRGLGPVSSVFRPLFLLGCPLAHCPGLGTSALRQPLRSERNQFGRLMKPFPPIQEPRSTVVMKRFSPIHTSLASVGIHLYRFALSFVRILC